MKLDPSPREGPSGVVLSEAARRQLSNGRPRTSPPPGPPSTFEKWLLRAVLSACGNPPIRVVLWNGDSICTATSAPVGDVVIHDHATLRRLALGPIVAFGEGYSEGRIDIEGDIVQVLCAIGRGVLRTRPTGIIGRMLNRGSRRRGHTVAASRESVHHHYDIGNEFYKLWLDEQLVYTCAYYAEPSYTLEQAQIAKMQHVCRKLRLRPGETVVEAGCGWGALALFMAEHYGVSVRAYNLSHEQIAHARDWAQRRGLAQRVEFVEDDYRNVSGTYDVFVSVGMLEHVGRENFRELGRVIDRSLAPAGRGLIHSIGRNAPRPLDAWIARRIFPGAYPPAISEIMEIFEPWRLSVLDIENIRLHYARTLEHWLERFERAADRVAAMFDERFVRTWRLYLAGSIAAFLTGSLQLFQVVFARESNNEIPWTRAHLYGP